MSFAGAIARSLYRNRAVSGAISFTGALIRSLYKNKKTTGDVSLSGDVVRKSYYGRIVTGVALIQAASDYEVLGFKRTITGLLTLTGAAVRKIFLNRTETGTLSLIGTVSAIFNPVWLRGSLSYVFKSASGRVVATISFVGGLARRVWFRDSVAGVVSFAGSLLRRRKVSPVSTADFVGTVTRSIRLFRRISDATVGFSGILNRTQAPQASAAGSLAFQGVLLIWGLIQRAVSSGVGFAGDVLADYRLGGVVHRERTGALALSGVTRWEAREPLYFGIPNP